MTFPLFCAMIAEKKGLLQGVCFLELSIPVPVLDLMERLEDRGFEAWAVGGCVRDWLLGLAPTTGTCVPTPCQGDCPGV